jgi:flagellar biogenesis protein FliO
MKPENLALFVILIVGISGAIGFVWVYIWLFRKHPEKFIPGFLRKKK